MPPPRLKGSFLWGAVLSDLYRRSGDPERAQVYAERAIGAALEGAVQMALRRRLSGDIK